MTRVLHNARISNVQSFQCDDRESVLIVAYESQSEKTLSQTFIHHHPCAKAKNLLKSLSTFPLFLIERGSLLSVNRPVIKYTGRCLAATSFHFSPDIRSRNILHNINNQLTLPHLPSEAYKAKVRFKARENHK